MSPTTEQIEPRLMTAEEVQQIRENMAKLLVNIGDPSRCKGCGAPIFFVRHKNGKSVPYTPQGLNHFADCPQAKEFKR
jgi:hypothetical protein